MSIQSMRRRQLSIWLGIPGLLATPSPGQAQVPAPIVVARSATPSPAGGQYAFFSSPTLNHNGQALFRSDLSGASSTTGLFVGMPGSIQTVATRSQPTPAGGTYNSFFEDYRINASGQIVFQNLVGSPISQRGLFVKTGDTTQTVALTGSSTPAGGTYSDLSNNGLAFNNSGSLVFRSNLSGVSGSSSALFVGNTGSVSALAVNNTSTPAGGKFGTFDDPTFNASGVAVFRSTVSNASFTAGIFAGTPGNLQAVAISGNNSPAGGKFLNFNAEQVGINAAGQVSFAASVSDGMVVIAGQPGSLQAVAQSGTTTSAGGTFSAFSNTVINSQGQVAFNANIRDSNNQTRSSVAVGSASANVQVVADVGSTAPGGGTFFTLSAPVLNGSGQVAFSAQLSNTTTATNEGLYAGLPGDLRLIVRKGDQIDVDPGAGVDLRTVSNISFAEFGTSGGEDGRALSFADNGTLIYRLNFTDSSSGVFITVVPVPEPAGMLAAISLFAWAGNRLRRRCHPQAKSGSGASTL